MEYCYIPVYDKLVHSLEAQDQDWTVRVPPADVVPLETGTRCHYFLYFAEGLVRPKDRARCSFPMHQDAPCRA